MIAVYDLACQQPTYDSVVFAMVLEQERLQRKEEVVVVEVVPGPNDGFAKPKVWPEDSKGQRHMLNRVAIPIINMLPSVRSVRVHARRPEALYDEFGYDEGYWQFTHFMQTYSAGVRPLRAPDTTVDPKLVTITLRECEHWPERNSQLGHWCEAARRIQDLGYRVVFVRDTLNADRPIPKFETYPRASKDVQLRALFYKQATCNLFVSNGPAWLAFALDAPALVIKPATEGVGRYSSTERVKRSGLGDMTGAPRHQRVVWQDDTCHNIVPAFRTFMEAQQCVET